MSEYSKAIRKLKAQKSLGPDRIHNEMIIHLGHAGRCVILKFYQHDMVQRYSPKKLENHHHNDGFHQSLRKENQQRK